MGTESANAIRKIAKESHVDPKVSEPLAKIAEAVPDDIGQEIKQALEDRIKVKQAPDGQSWPIIESITQTHHKDIGDAVMEAFEAKPDAVRPQLIALIDQWDPNRDRVSKQFYAEEKTRIGLYLNELKKGDSLIHDSHESNWFLPTDQAKLEEGKSLRSDAMFQLGSAVSEHVNEGISPPLQTPSSPATPAKKR